MSDEKIKLTVKIYEEVTETHEIIISKEEHKKIKDWNEDEHITDHISEDTLVDRRWGGTTDYEITKEEEVK